jgi:hypothetical protein
VNQAQGGWSGEVFEKMANGDWQMAISQTVRGEALGYPKLRFRFLIEIPPGGVGFLICNL